MELKSGWLGYIDRTHEQIMEAIRSRMPLKCPEITDLTDSNPMMKMASIYAGIAELLNYYIDSNAEEVYLSTANFYESGLKIAEMLGYKPQLARQATGLVTFAVQTAQGSDKTIQAGTEVSYNNVKYKTVSDVVLKAGQYSVSVDAENVSLSRSSTTISLNGTANERVILDVSNILEGSVIVTINGVGWSETYDFSDADGMTKCFRTGLNVDRKPYIEFGDGSYGSIPAAGSTAVITYLTTDGYSGNVASGVQMQMVSQTSISGLSVYAENGFSGGYDYEDLESMRKNIPRVYRARLRAITLQDFKDLIDAYTSVSQSAVAYDGNLHLTGYIVPSGGGIASETLLKNIQSYMSDKIPFLTTIDFLSAGQLEVTMSLAFNQNTGYSKIAVAERLKMNILELFNAENQKIRAKLYLSDIYEVIENTEGVMNSELTGFYIQPDVKPVNDKTSVFKGSVTVKAGKETCKWRIVMYSGTEYQLLKNGKYVGDYQVNETVSLDEMDLLLLENGYTNGTDFEFYTYRDLISTNSVELEEFSILSLDAKNLIIS